MTEAATLLTLPETPRGQERVARVSETAGLDFSSARPSPGQLAAAGFTFVMGYVSPSAWKNLTAAQAEAYRAAGLHVGLVWESGATRALSGAAGGAADGAAADAQLDALGYPTDAVIFWAVDYAEPAADFPVAAQYGAAFDLHTKRPAGVYGDYAVIEHFVTPGIRPVQYGWQTGAWSGSLLSGKAHLYQRRQPSGRWPVVAGTDEDVLCLPLPLWGATAPAPTPTPTPAPPPPPPPPPPTFDVRGWRVAYGQTDPRLPDLWGWGNRMYPAYGSTPITWGAGVDSYGPQTARFVAEFQRHVGIVGDGRNIGPQTAAALYAQGFRG